MTVTIDIAPDIEIPLREIAARYGQDIGAYLMEVAKREIAPSVSADRKHSILEFAGAGAKYASGQDAQEYVNELRAEWDRLREKTSIAKA